MAPTQWTQTNLPQRENSQLLKARYQGRITVGQTGAWLREKQAQTNYVVNVKALSPNNDMQGIEIYEFDPQGRMLGIIQAGGLVNHMKRRLLAQAQGAIA